MNLPLLRHTDTNFNCGSKLSSPISHKGHSFKPQKQTAAQIQNSITAPNIPNSSEILLPHPHTKYSHICNSIAVPHTKNLRKINLSSSYTQKHTSIAAPNYPRPPHTQVTASNPTERSKNFCVSSSSRFSISIEFFSLQQTIILN